MYVDTSLGKYLALLALLAVLGGAVAFTFTLKDMRFGATPFYSAITLLWQEATGHIAYPLRHALLSAGLRERPPASGEAKAIPALAYHRLVDQPDGHNVTVDTFREHMEALYAGGWQTVTLGELAAFLHDGKALPERSVLITFDDGAKQSFYPTDPILRSLGFSAVNYIIAKAPFQPESTYYLSDAEIARMLASGRWEIGSHSYDGHRPYAVDAGGAEGNFFADLLWNAEAGRLENQQEFVTRVDADLRRSRAGLEDAFGIPIDTFAFPFGETGLYVAGNFSDGVRLSETAAASVYSLAWLQAARSEFTYNYPDPEGFLARRIKVEPSWSGKDLVDALNDGLPKALPYGDMLVDDRGWRATWGDILAGGGELSVSASPETSGASVFLDGTRHWDDYQFEARVEWEAGYAMLAGDLVDEETYRLCSFSEGNVRLQDVKGGSRTLLGEADVPGLRHGAVRLGLRSDGTTVGCLWNGRTVLAVSSLADRNGGIGIQVWHEKTGEARLHATQVSVETASRENAYPLLRAHIEPRRQEGHLPAFPNIVIPQEAAPAPSATVVVAPAPQDPLADRRASGNTETAGSGADERRWGAPQGDFFPRWRDRLDDLLGNLDAERGRRR